MLVLELPIAEEQLAELKGEGDFTFLASLAIDGEQKVIQVHVRRRKFYDRMYAAASIANGADESMNPPLAKGARLVRR
jgi:hypothetical protein